MSPRKYRNVPTMVDGIRFASKAEAKRYGELVLLQRAGQISALALQPTFEFRVEGRKICRYAGDFAYFEGEQMVVEDVKGVETAVFKLKKKLLEAHHPAIELRIIRA